MKYSWGYGRNTWAFDKKEISPLALFTHCYAHCPNLSIAASCKLSEVRNLIGLINEAYLFLNNSPKRQQLFELTL